jgi:hypothetical protein
MIRRFATLLVFSCLLAGCGRQVDLAPKQGLSLPVKPEGAPKVPKAEELMTPPIQAKPQRSDEQLKRSEERKEDEFDLPPSHT